jgi:hypothetical protein
VSGRPACDVRFGQICAQVQYRLAHRSLLDYLVGSAVLEVDPEVYARVGDPYQLRESVESARAVFDATRLWQRDMYEHYQLGGGSPTKAAL